MDTDWDGLGWIAIASAMSNTNRHSLADVIEVEDTEQLVFDLFSEDLQRDGRPRPRL